MLARLTRAPMSSFLVAATHADFVVNPLMRSHAACQAFEGALLLLFELALVLGHDCLDGCAAHPQIAVPVLQDRSHHSVGPAIPSPTEFEGFESIAAHFQTVKAIPGAVDTENSVRIENAGFRSVRGQNWSASSRACNIVTARLPQWICTAIEISCRDR